MKKTILFILFLATIIFTGCGRISWVDYTERQAVIIKTGESKTVIGVPDFIKTGDTIVVYHERHLEEGQLVWLEDEFGPSAEEEGVKNKVGEYRYTAILK